MPIVDKQKRREYQRLYARRRRHAAVDGTEKKKRQPLADVIRMDNVEAVRQIIEEQIHAVRAHDVDVVVRARCIARLADVILKTIELGGLAERLAAIEKELGLCKELTGGE